mmetsp:Transcript_98663/g.287778  ORF Transcript_98663/g.287778 Transcript_98663/m.287778 type:complete len:356 (+) Transcript_98663:924-1991(+)
MGQSSFARVHVGESIAVQPILLLFRVLAHRLRVHEAHLAAAHVVDVPAAEGHAEAPALSHRLDHRGDVVRRVQVVVVEVRDELSSGQVCAHVALQADGPVVVARPLEGHVDDSLVLLGLALEEGRGRPLIRLYDDQLLVRPIARIEHVPELLVEELPRLHGGAADRDPALAAHGAECTPLLRHGVWMELPLRELIQTPLSGAPLVVLRKLAAGLGATPAGSAGGWLGRLLLRPRAVRPPIQADLAHPLVGIDLLVGEAVAAAASAVHHGADVVDVRSLLPQAPEALAGAVPAPAARVPEEVGVLAAGLGQGQRLRALPLAARLLAAGELGHHCGEEREATGHVLDDHRLLQATHL